MSKLIKSIPFAQVPNQAIRDRRLSLATLGMWSFLWNLPDDWDYSIAGLAKAKGCGVWAVTNAVKTLETYGYLRRVQCREANKFKGYDYVLIPNPDASFPFAGNSLNGKPVDGDFVRRENDDNIISTNIKSNNLISINQSEEDAEFIEKAKREFGIPFKINDLIELKKVNNDLGYWFKVLTIAIDYANQKKDKITNLVHYMIGIHEKHQVPVEYDAAKVAKEEREANKLKAKQEKDKRIAGYTKGLIANPDSIISRIHHRNHNQSEADEGEEEAI